MCSNETPKTALVPEDLEREYASSRNRHDALRIVKSRLSECINSVQSFMTLSGLGPNTVQFVEGLTACLKYGIANIEKCLQLENAALAELEKLRTANQNVAGLAACKPDAPADDWLTPEAEGPNYAASRNPLATIRLMDSEIDSIRSKLDFVSQTLESIPARWPCASLLQEVSRGRTEPSRAQEQLLANSREAVNRAKRLVLEMKRLCEEALSAFGATAPALNGASLLKND